jgi:hypothetical protein
LAGVLLGVVAPDPAHDQPGGDLVAGAVERGVTVSAICAGEIHRC